MARPTIISGSAVASAATSEPTASAPIETINVLFLPNMSPTRPAIGVAIDALSRYAVKIHAAAVGVAPRSRWITGSAGATSDCSSAYDAPADASVASSRKGRGWCVRASGMG